MSKKSTKKIKATKEKKGKNNANKFASSAKSFGHDIISFPSKLLAPVATFLSTRLSALEKRRKEIAQDDPFEDTQRLVDNASPDADAYEQFGHARASAIREEIDRKIIQTRKALARIKIGKYGICEDCGQMIDTDRLMVYPEATLCAKDQAKREK